MERALVVDDDPRILSVAQRWLLAAGYDVLTSDNFKDARAVIRVSEPAIVVLDVRLGEFNGLQLGLLAKEVRSSARVVIMSSWDDPVLRRETTEFGATFIHKPFRAPELLKAVQGD
jgi:DNA-binding response OmpR family regulator